jgi:hypothetical protein
MQNLLRGRVTARHKQNHNKNRQSGSQSDGKSLASHKESSSVETAAVGRRDVVHARIAL